MPIRVWLILPIVASAILSAYEVAVTLNDKETGISLEAAWGVVFLVCTVCWARGDARQRGIHGSLDAGFYLIVFWPIVMPAYLIRTRGLEGLILFIGFVAIYLAPYFSSLSAYVYLWSQP